MAGVRPLTEEEKELMSLYGKPITVYDILQAFSQDKPRFFPRCLSYKIQARKNKMYESLLLMLAVRECPNIDVSVKPDAFKNGVLNYDLEEHNSVNFKFYYSKSRMRGGQRDCRKRRKRCKIFEKYSDDLPRDKANELPHVNGDNISPPWQELSFRKRLATFRQLLNQR
ncbi:hypothetical protein F2Q70_00025025 [Brassica cretica]|uniref:Uncharacterized protein n=1 Tax=Brassica cretica TaxID=69181 RepID=A0A8S9L665_BRACR|nr:hypothetical protein F2Q70_00025025 [Brassica cretica]